MRTVYDAAEKANRLYLNNLKALTSDSEAGDLGEDGGEALYSFSLSR